MFGFLSEEPFLIKIICFIEIQYVEISGAFMISPYNKFQKTLSAGTARCRWAIGNTLMAGRSMKILFQLEQLSNRIKSKERNKSSGLPIVKWGR